MTATPNLNITHIAESQDQKEVTANAAFNAFDAAFTKRLDVSVSAGNATISSTNWRGYTAFRITGASVARQVTLQAIERVVWIESQSTNTATVSLVLGSTTITLQPGDVRLVYTDGTANGAYSQLHAAATAFMDVGFTKLGKPSGSEILLYLPFARPLRFPQNMSQSWAKARVAATASFTVSLSKVGSGIFATAVFAISGSTATFTCAADVDFAAGDILSVTAPASADATLEDIGFNFVTRRL